MSGNTHSNDPYTHESPSKPLIDIDKISMPEEEYGNVVCWKSKSVHTCTVHTNGNCLFGAYALLHSSKYALHPGKSSENFAFPPVAAGLLLRRDGIKCRHFTAVMYVLHASF